MNESYVTLANGSARATIRLDRGACVTGLYGTEGGRNALLTNPEANRSTRMEYDRAWIGGIDEICPTSGASRYADGTLADHGVLWNEAWSVVRRTSDELSVAAEPSAFPIRVERSLRLTAEGALHWKSLVENRSRDPIPLMWGAHIALPLSEDTAIRFGMDARPEPWPPEPWPSTGKPSSNDMLHIFPAPPGGNISVGTPGRPCVEIRFSASDLPWLHVWVSDGALFERRALCVEPFTSGRETLSDSIEQGTARWLGPSESAEFRLQVRVSHEIESAAAVG